MPILELKDVHYTYQTQYQKVQALKGITRSFDGGGASCNCGQVG